MKYTVQVASQHSVQDFYLQNKLLKTLSLNQTILGLFIKIDSNIEYNMKSKLIY